MTSVRESVREFVRDFVRDYVRECSSPNSIPVSPNTNEGLNYLPIYQAFNIVNEATCIIGSSPKREEYSLKN